MGEIVLLLLVGIIVVGPRNLPTMMRTAGQWVARLRRMSTELRSQSGIDDLLRREGLDEHIHQLRSLSRLNVVDSTMSSNALNALTAPNAPNAPNAPSALSAPTTAYAPGAMAARTPAMYPSARELEWKRDEPLREREYPLIGCDACGALPDDASPYHPAAPAEIATDGAVAVPEPPPIDAPAAADEPAATEAPT